MTSQIEEQLEADIWAALTRFSVTCPNAGLLVDALIVAARRYASGDSEFLTSLRRQVLDLAVAGEAVSDVQPTQPTGPLIPRRSGDSKSQGFPQVSRSYPQRNHSYPQGGGRA